MKKVFGCLALFLILSSAAYAGEVRFLTSFGGCAFAVEEDGVIIYYETVPEEKAREQAKFDAFLNRISPEERESVVSIWNEYVENLQKTIKEIRKNKK